MCEHIFHKDCLMEALHVRKECPTCKSTIDERSNQFRPLGRVLSNMLADSSVSCPQGCSKEMSWEQLKTHIELECPRTLFSCPHVGCEINALSRNAVRQHAMDCEHAIVTCSCQQQVKRKDLKEHKATTCSKELVTCSYCNKDNIERGALDEHLLNDCNASVTIPVVKPLQDLVNKLTREVQELKQKRSYEFQLNLPMPILDLPVDSNGKYEKHFGDNFFLQIYPNGNVWKPTTPGYMSVFVGSLNIYDGYFSIQIGAVRETTGDLKLGPARLGGVSSWGWFDFAKQSEMAQERIVHITFIVNDYNKRVIDLEM